MTTAIELRRFETPDQVLDMKERGGIAIVKMADGTHTGSPIRNVERMLAVYGYGLHLISARPQPESRSREAIAKLLAPA